MNTFDLRAPLQLPFFLEGEPGELLKQTRSRCPVCEIGLPAEVRRARNQVWLRRRCPEHGEQTTCIASDARFYWVSRGSSSGECCGGSACRASDGGVAGVLGGNAGLAGGDMDRLSTCVALIEVVNSCNLACPTCYADSPAGAGRVDAVPLEELKTRISGVLERKGEIDILQLSGGEPTLHPDLSELLEWLRGESRIKYVLLNTNGVRLAREPGFAERLIQSTEPGRFQIYLQYDGPQEAGQRTLRGADLRSLREGCLDVCERLGIPVTLAMTVTRENLGWMWAAVEAGLKWSRVRGITFQPVFGSGRGGIAAREAALTTADVILGLVDQSAGILGFEDFTPLPCGDPNCATTGYLLKVGDGVRSIGEWVDFRALQGFLADRLRYQVEDLARCGCESEPLGQVLKELEWDASHTFRLLIKPFMDARSWDEDRIDRCFTHVIRPDGRLDSFYRYYSGSNPSHGTRP